MEGENPTRRYKWFRPRQAASNNGFINPTNEGLVSLFNNSTGDRLLVVRSVRACSTANDLLAWSFLQPGHGANVQGSAVPFIGSNPEIPGLVYTDDLAGFGFQIGIQLDAPKGQDAWWEQPFPIAVVEPGWSFGIIHQTKGVDISVSFLSEAIFIEELDYIF